MFDGSFKSKRAINLGGRSVTSASKTDRAALLRQTQDERNRREEERRRAEAASRIQRFARSRLALLRWRAAARVDWDRSVSTLMGGAVESATWMVLLRALVLFFDPTKGDVARLKALVAETPQGQTAKLAHDCRGIVYRLVLAAIKGLPNASDSSDLASTFQLIVAIGHAAPPSLYPFLFHRNHIPALAAIFQASTTLPSPPPASFTDYLCLAAQADLPLWLSSLLHLPHLLDRTQLLGHPNLAPVLPTMAMVLSSSDPSISLTASTSRSLSSSTALLHFVQISTPTLLASVSKTVAASNGSPTAAAVTPSGYARTYLIALGAIAASSSSPTPPPPTPTPTPTPTSATSFSFGSGFQSSQPSFASTSTSFSFGGGSGSATTSTSSGFGFGAAAVSGSSSFSTSSSSPSFATASSTTPVMPVNVLASDPALRHAILDSHHIFALFAIADAHSADPPLQLAFCTLLAPLLPHLPLSRSPFPILTRGRLLRALFHSAMATAARDMSVMSVEAALASAAHRNALYVLSDALHRVCSAAGDDEFYAFTWLSAEEMVTVAEYLKVVTFHAINSGWGQWVEPWAVKGWVKTVRHLHDRDSRRQFTPSTSFWYMHSINTSLFIQQATSEMPPAGDYARLLSSANKSDSDFDDDSDSDSDANLDQAERQRLLALRDAAMSPRHRILRDIPFVLPFADRVHLFRTFIQLDKDALGYGAERDIILTERQRLTVRRDHVFEDGFVQLSKLGGTLLRSRLAISFISELGLDEAGVDGGGVWKEFFSLLSKEAFHPDSGLFLTTDHDHALYPNPSATSPVELRKFEFVGRVVGKALYDGLLVGAAFAPFFINHWLQRSNLFDDLPSLDPVLYKHLVYLKNMPSGEVEELGVSFTVDVKDRGQTRTLELMRGGAHTPVTCANRIKYTYLVANFKLNHLIQRQCRAFLSGLSDLIRPEWLQLFNQTELLHLVSGSDEPIDIADMRAHTIYGGEYSASHRVIRNFWQVAEELGTEDRRLLLRFITSSTRAPLLGFKELVPALCIRPGGDDQEWLPTASTCVNLLKLPVYRDWTTLREKLLYSIRSGVGFELS